jgi:electron transfer flavoprotein alpha subunit
VVEAHHGAPVAASLEIAPLAHRLAGRLAVRVEGVLLGGGEGLASALGAHGVAAVHLLAETPDEGGDLAGTVDAVSALAGRARPAVILFAATRLGSELAARVAARLGAGLMPQCERLEVEPDGTLRGERRVYAGRATAAVVCRPAPAIATVAAGAAADLPPAPSNARPEVWPLAVGAARRARLEVERVWRPGPWEMDLGEAEVIVAGGRGLATAEDFAMLADLAEVLGGAVAASRPVVDARVVPYDRQVGLSGRTVTPRLYIACAISGGPHHVIGMRGAETVVAINEDRHAPIFDLADLAITADARRVVPAVTARLREMAAGEQVVAAGQAADAFTQGQPAC